MARFLVLALAISVSGSVSADDFFEKKIAPIFRSRCLSCHNDVENKGDFSVQSSKTFLTSGFVEPKAAEGSHLLTVLQPKNGKAQMPKNGDPLSKSELALVRQWIDQGAVWPKGLVIKQKRAGDFNWWSFQPLDSPSVPQLNDPWVKTPIDAFVLSRLRQKKLRPSQIADRRTLIRRLSYDLTGLPPTPEETEAFAKDDRADAYERLVDRLLESKHYGERWARHWLDIVKYADTCGYDKDKLRPNAWPYRDYVIRSFNDDKPYSRFVQEQIAGDVLFPNTADGILGLGFIAAGPWDFIGHVEVPESKIDGKVARNLDRDDMVSNTLNTFCSITIQCARCHNHKFDPFTQDDYYGLQAIFAAVDRAERPFSDDSKQLEQQVKLSKKVESVKEQIAKIEARVRTAGGQKLAALNADINELNKNQKVRKGPEYGYHSAIMPKPNHEKWVYVDLGEKTQISEIILHACHDEFGNINGGFGFPQRFRVEAGTDGKKWTVVQDNSQHDYPNPKLAPVAVEDLELEARYVRIIATKLAKRSNDYIFAIGELRVLDEKGNNLALNKKVTSLDSIEAPIRWARRNLTDGKWAKGADPKVAEKLAAKMAERTELFKKIFPATMATKRKALGDQLAAAESKLAKLTKNQPVVYAAATHFKAQANFKPTMGKMREIKVLHRGDIQSPGAAARPGVIPLSSNVNWKFPGNKTEAERRAALAKWLTRKDHPLVWRSIVNRIWQYHFGQGLVATPNDFGRMGAQPTHPELLDYLAIQFRDGGQSFKKLHRLIVTSNSYKQQSSFDEAKAKIDGSNQFLWRMNRRRLTAEEIRDSILRISGTLNAKMGGPGFYLFKLEKTAHSPHYEYHKFDPADQKSHRRSIYRFIVRSQPDPWMTTLDCADSSQSTPKRNETLTSLQALSLLNNKFNLLMAEKFAERVKRESKSIDQQVERALKLVAQRGLRPQERAALVEYANQHGMKQLCRVLFNLSEFVFVD